MFLSEESLQKIHSYMDTHEPSEIHDVLSQVSSPGIRNGQNVYRTLKEGEYEIFAETIYGYGVYALYKYKGVIYGLRSGFNGYTYNVYAYCHIENDVVFDKYI